MIYTVYCVNGDETVVLHSPVSQDHVLINPVLTLEVNKTGTLTFQIPQNHPEYSKLRKMESEIVVYEGQNKLWTGRALSCEINFYNIETVTCEGIMGYLLDSQMPPFVNQAGITSFLTSLLTNHNNRVGTTSKKAIQLGRVTVTDDNDYIYRASENYNSTLDLINEKLINTLGGYISLREENGVRYLDYLATAQMSTQTVAFGENLIDMSRLVDSDSLCTAVIPRGAEYEVTTGSGEEEETETHTLDIVDYPTTEYHQIGTDYVYDPAAVQTYGFIYKVVEFDKVSIQQHLYQKALEYLRNSCVFKNIIELTAVDLSLLDSNLESFKLMDAVKVVSVPHGVSATYLVNAITYDLANPANSVLSLNGSFDTYTRSIVEKEKRTAIELKKAANRIRNLSDEEKTNRAQIEAQITKDIQRASDLIKGVNGGNIVIDTLADGTPYQILIMDTDNKATATNVIRLNAAGLGFSTTGYDGTYRNAWTIDGHLVADFVTAAQLTTGKISGWNIGPTMFSNGTVGTDGYIAFSSVNGIQLGVDAFVFDKQTGALSINANEVKIKATGSGDSVFQIEVKEDMNPYTQWSRTKVGLDEFEISHFMTVPYGGNPEWLDEEHTVRINNSGIEIVDVDYESLQGLRMKMSAWNGIELINRNDETVFALNGIGLSGGFSEQHDYYQIGRTGLWCQEVNAQGTTTGSTLGIASNGQILKKSSSERYKEEIKDIEDFNASDLYDVHVRQFKYKKDWLEKDDEKQGMFIPGLIAEEVEEAIPIATIHNAKGQTENWDERILLPLMLKLLQDQHKEIELLKEKVARLEEN